MRKTESGVDGFARNDSARDARTHPVRLLFYEKSSGHPSGERWTAIKLGNWLQNSSAQWTDKSGRAGTDLLVPRPAS
jgi:hypothetical protein